MGTLLERLRKHVIAVTLGLTLGAGASLARPTNVIYYMNDTDETIITAIGCFDSRGRWVFTGYWTLGPGEYQHVANSYTTKNYVWAVSLDSGSEWKGDFWKTVPRDGEKRAFRPWSTPARWGTFTYRFHW